MGWNRWVRNHCAIYLGLVIKLAQDAGFEFLGFGFHCRLHDTLFVMVVNVYQILKIIGNRHLCKVMIYMDLRRLVMLVEFWVVWKILHLLLNLILLYIELNLTVAKVLVIYLILWNRIKFLFKLFMVFYNLSLEDPKLSSWYQINCMFHFFFLGNFICPKV